MDVTVYSFCPLCSFWGLAFKLHLSQNSAFRAAKGRTFKIQKRNFGEVVSHDPFRMAAVNISFCYNVFKETKRKNTMEKSIIETPILRGKVQKCQVQKDGTSNLRAINQKFLQGDLQAM